MKLYNKTQNNTIAKDLIICKSILSQARGLMFRNQQNLVFPSSKEKFVPLHMWFVFFSIDVLFLDKNKKVVEIKKNFKPFSFYNPKNKSRFVIELANGIVKKKNIQIGDLLEYRDL